MKDVVLVLALLAFFGVCVLYVHACGIIMGPDDAVDMGVGPDDDARADAPAATDVMAGS
jgi:hypothetical protein